MKCPIDNQTLTISDRSGIEIDFCPECRGVWLDRGELDKIIERSGQYTPNSTPSAPHSPQQNGGYNDHSYDPRHKKKKESFLGDLFDF